MTTATIKNTIWYAGVLCKFEVEVNTIDEAQYWIDYYNRLGYKSCSLHERGKHQIYVETREKSVPCPHCEDRMFLSILDHNKGKYYCVMCNENFSQEDLDRESHEKTLLNMELKAIYRQEARIH